MGTGPAFFTGTSVVRQLEKVTLWGHSTIADDPTVALDVFRNITETLQLKAETFNIHYNKTAAEISFDERFRKVSVISAAGKIVLTAENTDSIATRQLSPGTYIVNALAYSGKESKAKVLLY
jgi:ABC-type oligopeptide transport system ATPase subunit